MVFKLRETLDEVVNIGKRDKGYIDFDIYEWMGGGITMTPPGVEVRLEYPRQANTKPRRNDL